MHQSLHRGNMYICRSIKSREKEHKRAIRNIDENHSGISKHVLETGHSIAWEGSRF